jgi:hypothetical protein
MFLGLSLCGELIFPNPENDSLTQEKIGFLKMTIFVPKTQFFSESVVREVFLGFGACSNC